LGVEVARLLPVDDPKRHGKHQRRQHS
jgi:hypothetical protein